MNKKIYLCPEFWTTPLTKHLSHGAKLLAMYCLTGMHQFTNHPHTVSLATAQADLNWPPDILIKRLQELSHRAFVRFMPGNDYYEIATDFQHAFLKIARKKNTGKSVVFLDKKERFLS